MTTFWTTPISEATYNIGIWIALGLCAGLLILWMYCVWKSGG